MKLEYHIFKSGVFTRVLGNKQQFTTFSLECSIFSSREIRRKMQVKGTAQLHTITYIQYVQSKAVT